jgi:hypothetical protein
MSSGANALEPAGSKQRGYLREHRLRIAIWIGAVEGALALILGNLHIAVYVLAAVAILFWAFVGRKYESGTARDLSWIFAASQAIAVLVPATLHIFKLLAIGVIVIAAVVGLVILFTDRGHEKT